MSHTHFHQDERERRKWQEPYAILREVGLGPGMIFVDMGCGPGFFVIPAAEMVGEDGRVYAVDADPRSIEKLEGRASGKGLKNIVLKAARAEETVLFDGRADIVFFGIDLHDFDDPVKVLANAMRMLKMGGKAVDLDWKRKAMSFGPPLWKRFTEDKAKGLISDAGFRIALARDCGRYHYLIIGEKA
jgi:ubiquinone/menaquinone biosynthesis C-methylase UbiE